MEWLLIVLGLVLVLLGMVGSWLAVERNERVRIEPPSSYGLGAAQGSVIPIGVYAVYAIGAILVVGGLAWWITSSL